MTPQLETPLGQLRQAIRSGRTDVRLLVPTATLAEHRRHQLAREGLVFRPDLIQTLSRFVADLVPSLRQVSEPLFQIFVERALRAIRPVEFNAVADAPGFAQSLSSTIRKLDAAGVTPGELQRICRDWPYSAALASIWSAASEELSRRRQSLRGGLLRAASRAAQNNGTVLLDGFAKLSAPESEVLRNVGTIAQPELLGCEAATISRFAADSDTREAEEIARRILAVHAGGVPFREIGIALRNPERHVSVLRPILERFGIPARFYFTEPLAVHAVTRLFAGTIEAFLSGWNHELCLPVIRLISTDKPAWRDRLEFTIREQIPNSGLASLHELRAGWIAEQWEILSRNWQRRLTPQTWAEQLGVDLRRTYRLRDVSATAADTFDAALTEAADVDTAPCSLAEFWAVARVAVENTALRFPDRRRNVVQVMSVYEVRQWELDTVFVCGLAEKAFPKRHPSDAFLPDAAMENLKRAGFGVFTSGDLDREEHDLFRMVRDSARRELVLSYAAEQKDGPSEFWGPPEEDRSFPALVRPARRELSAPRPPTTRIAEESLLQWMAERNATFSVTALENYLGCGFKYFSLNLMGLKAAPVRPEKRLGFLEEGNVVHETLEKWAVTGGPVRPVLDRVFEAYCERKRVVRGYRSEASYARMLGDLERFTRSSWPRHEVIATELKTEFQLATGLTIRGRVDRLERLADGRIVIVDYKYSNATNTKGKVDDETKLQGPLYVHGLTRQGETVAAMVYFSLKKSAEAFGWGEVSGLGKQLEPLTEQWVEGGVAEALRAAEGIRSGYIPVLQQAGPPCKYCEAKDVCRVEEAAGLALTAGFRD